MEQISLFEETQEPNKKIASIFMVILIICVVVAAVNFFVIKNLFVYIPLLPLTIISLIFIFLVTRLGIKLQICSDGIYYQLKPFGRNEKFISFGEIEEIKIGQLTVPYRNFKYGGFSIKTGVRFTMYLFGGYDALHLKMKTGKTIIFSTRKMQEMIAAAKKMDKNKVKVIIQ